MGYKDRKGKPLGNFIDRHNRNFFNRQVVSDDEISLGEEFKVQIKSIGSKGDGIGKYKSYTVIVADAKVGDSIKVAVTNVRGNLLFAEIVKET